MFGRQLYCFCLLHSVAGQSGSGGWCGRDRNGNGGRNLFGLIFVLLSGMVDSGGQHFSLVRSFLCFLLLSSDSWRPLLIPTDFPPKNNLLMSRVRLYWFCVSYRFLLGFGTSLLVFILVFILPSVFSTLLSVVCLCGLEKASFFSFTI